MLHAWYGLLLAASLTLTGQPFSIDHPTPTTPMVESADGLQSVHAPYPPAVQDALRSVRKSGGHSVVRADQKTYVVIGAGQRPTGGYRLVAERVEKTGTHGYIIHVREQKPAAGAMKTQVISYPTLVVAVPDNQAQVKVIFS
ncbi:protease complex subunit PrcB family protein [Brevibacillus ruminantium]|uniref:Protease complex subunit PrcB family protein n=1 Tax=Brevibacillus ruminantium TaxID=2950604 RepID=A0ABY4WCP9_9BACL|nr:protease complex subunit PrcB family protein [Brevibacillus ruminantium]USG63692.1 protease complex subunit PrcB family protein [Brevibacillus ruminantium]